MKKPVSQIADFFNQPSLSQVPITHYAFDSRKVKKGTLFFALSGEKVDGHAFLSEVAAKGGVAAVVLESYKGDAFGMELIYVSDVKRALQDLSQALFKERSPFIIGVTGTVGKTTTKEFLATLLSEKFRVAKSPGSMNSQVGLPLSLLNSDPQAEVVVLEMGMSQKNELKRLVEIAPPHLGILTKVTLAHATFFRDLEEIAKAKCELFSSVKMERGFFHLSTQKFQAVQGLSIPKTWFDTNDLKDLPRPFEEKHLLENFLAAATVARYLGLNKGDIEEGAKKLKPLEHRFEKIEKKGVFFIDDSYNASPEGAKTALTNLPKGEKRMAVFGAMKELGAFSKQCHREVAEHALPLLDELICIGEEALPMVEVFKKGGKIAYYFEEKKSAGIKLKEVISKGDVVLLKGSNSFKLWTLLEEI